MDSKLVLDVCLNLIMFAVAVYAIRDGRKQASDARFLERNRVYAKTRDDMAWQYIDPTKNAQESHIARELEEFCILAQAAEPGKWTIEVLKDALENESLRYASMLVEGDYGVWKPDLIPEKVKKKLEAWQTDLNREKIQNLLAKKERLFLF
jgi:hypothetical protein